MIIIRIVKALDIAVLDPLAAFREDRENEPEAGYPELTDDMKQAIPFAHISWLACRKWSSFFLRRNAMSDRIALHEGYQGQRDNVPNKF
mmetsp:Transcript_10919/g.15026  ORF Transcript_10919/g.15026 Transcript_10919/m.15026 type:complete len:89 (-) Transcript_10919:1195-1461(-)